MMSDDDDTTHEDAWERGTSEANYSLAMDAGVSPEDYDPEVNYTAWCADCKAAPCECFEDYPEDDDEDDARYAAFRKRDDERWAESANQSFSRNFLLIDGVMTEDDAAYLNTCVQHFFQFAGMPLKQDAFRLLMRSWDAMRLELGELRKERLQAREAFDFARVTTQRDKLAAELKQALDVQNHEAAKVELLTEALERLRDFVTDMLPYLFSADRKLVDELFEKAEAAAANGPSHNKRKWKAKDEGKVIAYEHFTGENALLDAAIWHGGGGK